MSERGDKRVLGKVRLSEVGGGGGGERGKRLWKKTHNGVESRMRGCWSSRKLREWSEGSQVER